MLYFQYVATWVEVLHTKEVQNKKDNVHVNVISRRGRVIIVAVKYQF